MISLKSSVTGLLAGALLAVPASAFEVKVTVENVAPEGGVILTPMWVGFHKGQFDSYDGGVSVDGFPGMEQIAEDGNFMPLSNDFNLQVPMGVDGAVFGTNGPIFPGESAELTVEINPDYHRYFSYVSMAIPSNDAFVANGNPLAHRVFDTNGNFTPLSFYILGKEVNDAGTEVNDEVPANTAALAQMAPNTGVSEGGAVTDHPGHMEGGNVLAAIPNGQFILPGYRLAKVTVSAVPTTRIYFPAGGDQEATPNMSNVTGACHAKLNEARTSLYVSCDHNVENVVAAHVHRGAPGTNGPVVLPFDEAGPGSIGQMFDVDDAIADAFLNGDLYVNIHSEAFPGGEIRGQIDGCFEGPGGLCLNDRRFQVSATWTTGNGDQPSTAFANTNDAGFFTFFNSENIELDVKLLNGCEENGNYWVFAAGLTNVGVTLTVEDTWTGQTRTYTNANGNTFETITDIEAFATCP